MVLTSDAFNYGKEIPVKYTCDGENISPGLSWDSFPQQTKSFALTCYDPDAPSGGWVHWVVYNIPADINSLSERLPSDRTIQNGINQGLTDFRTTGYGGPCPPSGTHRYFFKVYALDEELDLEPGLDMNALMKRMSPHIIDSGELMGVYSRKR